MQRLDEFVEEFTAAVSHTSVVEECYLNKSGSGEIETPKTCGSC